MRNALLPQLTKLALAMGHIVSGAILVEVIFSYPGIGFRLYQAIQSNDYFVIQGIVLVLSISIAVARSEEHTSELQSLMRISYAVFCLKKKIIFKKHTNT